MSTGGTTPSEPSSNSPSDASSDLIAADSDLVIRRMRDAAADYELMVKWLNDERVLQFWDGRDHALDREAVVAKYGPRALGQEGTVPCIIEEAGRPIGYIQFYRTDDTPDWRDQIELPPDPRRFGIDLFIGEPERWGAGLGTRAVRMMLDFLFGQLDASEVALTTFSWNERAIRSYEKAGFRRVRLLPKLELHEGELQDEWLMVAEPGVSREPNFLHSL